jgi:REP element-mobilizing transposase RayT
MGEILLDTETTCFAWSLMPNHFHLLLRTEYSCFDRYETPADGICRLV